MEKIGVLLVDARPGILSDIVRENQTRGVTEDSDATS